MAATYYVITMLASLNNLLYMLHTFISLCNAVNSLETTCYIDTCLCWDYNLIDCSDRQLSKVPSDLPSWTKVLWVHVFIILFEWVSIYWFERKRIHLCNFDYSCFQEIKQKFFNWNASFHSSFKFISVEFVSIYIPIGVNVNLFDIC